MKKTLAILNTSILTAEGTFSLKSITLDDAKNLVQKNEILSAVGHVSTAEILTELLGTEIPVNRIQFAQEDGQQALVFKLNGRPPEGKILSREEIETNGYKFQLLEKEDNKRKKSISQDVHGKWIKLGDILVGYGFNFNPILITEESTYFKKPQTETRFEVIGSIYDAPEGEKDSWKEFCESRKW